MSVLGPTNLGVNCRSWAQYEAPGSTDSASLCNGGWFDGREFSECPSKEDCKAQTLRNNNGRSMDGRQYQQVSSYQNQNNRQLQVINNRERPYGSAQFVQGTSARQQVMQQQPARPQFTFREMDLGEPLPVSIRQNQNQLRQPQQQQRQEPPKQPLVSPMQLNVPVPFPVQPPMEWPRAMQTQYVAPTLQASGATPTFLPADGESIPARLAKNIAQGCVGASGWHIFSMAQSIDMFR